MKYNIDLLPFESLNTPKDIHKGYVLKINIRGNMVFEILEEHSIMLESLIDGGFSLLLLDLTGLEYIDSSGLSLLIKIAKKIRAKKGSIASINLSGKILGVFHTIKMENLIPNFPFEKKALHYLFSGNFS